MRAYANYKRRSAVAAALLGLGWMLWFTMCGEDSVNEAVEFKNPDSGGLYWSVFEALRDVDAQPNPTIWAKVWCHPTTCANDEQAATFLSSSTAPHTSDLPKCLTPAGSAWVKRGWTQAPTTGVGPKIEHIVIECRGLGRNLHVQAIAAGEAWKIKSLAWEEPTSEEPARQAKNQ